jgi:hypothetical protein
MSGNKDQRTARIDAGREKKRLAVKRAVGGSNNNLDEAYKFFRRNIEGDPLIMEAVAMDIIEEGLRDRPDLKNDPEGLFDYMTRKMQAFLKAKRKATSKPRVK